MKKLALVFLALLALTGLAQAQLPITFPAPQGQPVAVTCSSTGTTGAITCTLAAVANKRTYICGFVVSSGGTTGALVDTVTVAGTVGGTMSYRFVFVSAGQGLLGVAYGPTCISSSAVNTAIVVSVPAGGTGTLVAANAWGFQN